MTAAPVSRRNVTVNGANWLQEIFAFSTGTFVTDEAAAAAGVTQQRGCFPIAREMSCETARVSVDCGAGVEQMKGTGTKAGSCERFRRNIGELGR